MTLLNISYFFPGTTSLPPATETTAKALIPPTPTATVTNAPLHHPHRLHLEQAVPSPSHRRVTAKPAITVSVTVRNPPRAATAAGGEGSDPTGKKEAQRGVQLVTCTLTMQVKLAAWR